MKRIILIILIALMTMPVVAQDNALFNQLTEKYADKNGFSASMLTSDLFDLYIKKKDIDDKSPVYSALKELDKIIVVLQNGYPGPIIVGGDFDQDKFNEKNEEQKKERNELYNEIEQYYKDKKYTLFKTENQSGEDLKVYLKKENDLITSLALITNSAASTNPVELDGKIDLSNVAELSKALNLKGLEKLYKLNSNSPYVGTYAVSSGNTKAYELAEELAAREREFVEQQSSMKKEIMEREKRLIEDQKAKVLAEFEKQAQMAEKMRQMNEVYGRQPIFLSTPGDTNTVYFINGKKVKANEVKELDKNTISSIEVKNPEKEDDKTEVKIKTKK